VTSSIHNHSSRTESPTTRLAEAMQPGPISSPARLWVMVVAGGVLLAVSLAFAQFPDIIRYTFGDRTGSRDPNHLAVPLLADLGVIGGYGLFLAGCALVVSRLATSPSGGRFGRIAFGCNVVAVLADLLEDLGLFGSTFTGSWGCPGFDNFVTTATAAVATVKWSALLIAAISAPAAFAILMIRWRACKQMRTAEHDLEELAEQVRLQAGTSTQSTPASDSRVPPANSQPGRRQSGGQQWWTQCRADDGRPRLHDESIKQDTRTWVDAYNVPGAEDVIDQRESQPVHAICLSGGGVRSASIAMGALQVLSRAHPDSSPGTLNSASLSPAVKEPDPEVPQVQPRSGDATSPGPDNTASEKFIDTVDYVISVSGGGYTAGARLLACKEEPTDRAARGVEAARTESSSLGNRPVRISERFGEGSVEFEHIRRNSSYIADSIPSLLRALGHVARNLVASVVMVFWTPVALGLAGGYLLAYFPIAAIVPVPRYTDTAPPHPLSETDIRNTDRYFQSLLDHPYAWWGLGCFALCAVALLARALCIEVRSYSEASEERRARVLARMSSVLIVGLAVAILLVGLPALMRLCASTIGTSPRPAQVSGTVASILGLQYLSAIVAMGWRQRTRFTFGSRGGPSRLKMLPVGAVSNLLALATLAVLGFAWLATLGCVAAGVFGYATQGVGGPLRQIPWLLWWVAATAALIAMLGGADVTSLSLHPFYRWRLANTFAVRREPPNIAGEAQSSEPYAQAYPATEPTWLHTHGAVKNGPKFVFCAAAAISGSGKTAPGLNAVSFALSADYMGGPELGWLKTDKLWAAATPRLKRDLTVEAAVAVSGAAFASSMGRQNKGYQTLLAISGARLGTWLPNPAHVERLCERFPEPEQNSEHEAAFDSESKLAAKAGAATADSENVEDRPETSARMPQRELLKGLPMVRGFSYFYRELFAQHDINARLVQITDGGHYENLGLVEALRRRARVIVCIDGGGDPPPLLSGLADAMRLARSELGVQIDLHKKGDYSVENLAPGRGKPFPKGDALELLNPRITKGTVICGRILYPAASGLPEDRREGLLILAKAVVWEGCPDWLLTYAGNSAIFPHDSTSDQWFTEGQFAAYTELGRILGHSVIEAYNAADGPVRPHLKNDDVVPA
jgi:hypothetical protein